MGMHDMGNQYVCVFRIVNIVVVVNKYTTKPLTPRKEKEKKRKETPEPYTSPVQHSMIV